MTDITEFREKLSQLLWMAPDCGGSDFAQARAALEFMFQRVVQERDALQAHVSGLCKPATPLGDSQRAEAVAIRSAARAQALEEAAKVCAENRREASGFIGLAHNAACADCAAAVRALIAARAPEGES